MLMNQDQSNRELMLSVMRAFKEGDLAPLFAAIHPDIVWQTHAPREFFRFGGVYHGAAGMKEYTALLFSRYHYTRIAPRAVTAQGDHVWGLFEVEAQHIPSGRYVKSELVMRWTVKDGRITEHHSFFDTAGVLLQQGDVAVEAA
jgi:ketosteroid isomerase-like protein